MKNLKLALIGTEPVLMEITQKIQEHKLDSKDEKDILFPSEKDKNNPYMKYLQACIYTFGSKTITPDLDKAKRLINDISDNIDSSAGWALNLGCYIANKFPENSTVDDKNKFLQKAARLGNPLALQNLAMSYIGENNKEFVSIITQVYKRLPPNTQKDILLSINKIEALPGTLSDPNLCLAIGNFYKELNQPEQAKDFYLRSKSTEAWTYCQRHTSKESEKKLMLKIEGHLEALKNIKEELSSQFILNYPKDEFEYLKQITKAVHDRMDVIKHEIELISSCFGNKKNFTNSGLGQLVTAAKTLMDTTEKLLEHRDKIIKNVEDESKLIKASEELVSEGKLLAESFKDVKKQNTELQKEVEKLKNEIKETRSAASQEEKKPQQPDEEVFFQRFGSQHKKG